MKISSISIVGLGLIGGSIAKALKRTRPAFTINAFDKKSILQNALSLGAIDHTHNKLEEVSESDLIILCLPIEESIKAFKKLAPKLRKNQILTDVCSVKSVFYELWLKMKSSGKYIGGHPMTGKELSGFENSDPLLFENSIYILTEDLNRSKGLKEFRAIIESLGANILHIPARQHDVIAASVSHLPQLVSVALVNTSSLKTESYNFLDLAAGGFRDMTRIASSNFELWESIILENRSEIITAMDKFSFEVDKLKQYVQQNDSKQLAEYFESARRNRDEIPLNSKGFLKPLFDIYVFVKDEPGVISKISTALFVENLNIKDMELLKIREGLGGTFRLSFDSTEDAQNAKSIIEGLGFKTN